VKARTASQEHLNRKFSPIESAALRRTVDDYLLATYSRSARGAPERTPKQRIELTAALLANRRRDTGQTFYMLFYLPEDAEGQNAMRTLVESLKEDYPAIMFLGLDAAFEQELEDSDLVYPFCRMLPMKGRVLTEKGDTSP